MNPFFHNATSKIAGMIKLFRYAEEETVYEIEKFDFEKLLHYLSLKSQGTE